MEARSKIEARLEEISAIQDDVSTELDSMERARKELEAKFDDLDQEAEKLRLALEVLTRFEAPETSQAKSSEKSSGNRARIEFPPDAPKNVAGMVKLVLRESETGKLTALEILDQIQHLWLPDLKRTSLSPALSRLRKRGELIREGHNWLLPNNEEAEGAATPSASNDSQNDFFG